MTTIRIDKRTEAIQQYLETGTTDSCYPAWSSNTIEGLHEGSWEVRGALIEAVRTKAADTVAKITIPPMLEVQEVRAKLTPMIDGFFPENEREAVLSLLAKNVFVLTPNNFEEILLSANSSHTAWELANLYLASVGAEPLHKDARCALGMNEGTTSYVSMKYFTETDKFADYIVHEVAHAFHNCRRTLFGLKEKRRRQFLLDVDFHERETFAYACEVYSRILVLASTMTERIALTEQALAEFVTHDEFVDRARFRAALEAASSERNGWKKILEICYTG